MEFPVLLELPLPATCRKFVTQFLRPGEPHPTARLINLLTFRRDEAGYDSEDEDQCFPACLGVTGPGIRILDLSFWHPFGAVQPQCLIRRPQYVVRGRITPFNDRSMLFSGYGLGFHYDEVTGEHIPERDESDANSEEDNESYSDGGGSLGSEFLNSDGELAGFRD